MSDILGAVFRLGVVLLGAGRSRRMGQSKLLLPWGPTSIIGHLVDVWRKVGGCQIAVVCAADRPDVLRELDRLLFDAASRIINPEPDRGMFSSIQCAATWPGWRPELTQFVIALGDQPHLSIETLSHLSLFAADHAGQICQPAYRGRRAHPLFFPRKVFQELATAQAQDLREFLQQREVLVHEINDPGLAWDIDTPEDYRRLSNPLNS